MKKHLYLVILLSSILSFKGFSQAFPPVINSYTDTIGGFSMALYLNYTANDTGTIYAQVQLQKGTGHDVYDSIYSFPAPAGDSGTVQLNVGPISPCTNYQLLINMRNSHAQGTVINPLFTFATLCTGITSLNENSYSLIAFDHSIELKATELPERAMVEVYDLTGRLILTAPLNQSVQQIPFNQNAGIYLLRITGNGQLLYTNRFVTY